MEPITNVSQIPGNRWALICCLCKEKTGACIQVGSPGRAGQCLQLESRDFVF